MLKNFFQWKQPKRGSASAAKERLQIIVSHRHQSKHDKDNGGFVKQLQSELIAVIAKYVKVTEDQVRVSLENSGKSSVLELNVTLPEEAKS
jgi:cell division topological specificity factor